MMDFFLHYIMAPLRIKCVKHWLVPKLDAWNKKLNQRWLGDNKCRIRLSCLRKIIRLLVYPGQVAQLTLDMSTGRAKFVPWPDKLERETNNDHDDNELSAGSLGVYLTDVAELVAKAKEED